MMKAISDLISYDGGGATNQEHTHFVFHGVKLLKDVGQFPAGSTLPTAILYIAEEPNLSLCDDKGKQHNFQLKFAF